MNLLKINWAHHYTRSSMYIPRGLQCIFLQCLLCCNYFQYLWSENVNYLQVVKIQFSENWFSISLRSFFSTYKFFLDQEWLFRVRTFTKKYFNEKMSSLTGLKKSFLLSRKSNDFGHFWIPRSTFKIDFLNVGEKFRKILGSFVKESC